MIKRKPRAARLLILLVSLMQLRYHHGDGRSGRRRFRFRCRATQFDTLATETLNMAIDGLKEIDVASLKATDIRALAEISERAVKMYELLEGRATERTEGMTRGKMDELLGEMEQEIEERLARIKTIH